MATIQKPKKAASKMMAGEMTGKMYKKSAIDKIGDKQAAELDKSGVYGKAAMAKKKMRDGGNLASGVGGKKPKAGMVDPKGAWTKVQERTIGKAKDGKGFPDLNKDGKVTKADILKGRGVIAKKGAKVMPCASCGKKMAKKK